MTLGNTRVLAGVKIDVAEPMRDTEDQGNLVVSSELLPMASPDFEVGPPRPEAVELARVVDRGIRAAECIDMSALFIEPGKVWAVYIDVYVLDHAGNLFDASELAAMTALMSAHMPSYENGKVVRERGDGKRLKINATVTSTTFFKVADMVIYDANGYEEKAAPARLTIASSGRRICAMQKGLAGSFMPAEIGELAAFSLERHKELSGIINEAVRSVA